MSPQTVARETRKRTSDSSQGRRYTRRRSAAIARKAIDAPVFSLNLNGAVENAIIHRLVPPGRSDPAGKHTSGGDDAGRRARVAGTVGAPAPGTSRSRC